MNKDYYIKNSRRKIGDFFIGVSIAIGFSIIYDRSILGRSLLTTLGIFIISLFIANIFYKKRRYISLGMITTGIILLLLLYGSCWLGLSHL